MLMFAAIMIPVIGGIAIYAASSDGRSRNTLYAVCMLLTDAAAIAAAFRSSPIVLALGRYLCGVPGRYAGQVLPCGGPDPVHLHPLLLI